MPKNYQLFLNKIFQFHNFWKQCKSILQEAFTRRISTQPVRVFLRKRYLKHSCETYRKKHLQRCLFLDGQILNLKIAFRQQLFLSLTHLLCTLSLLNRVNIFPGSLLSVQIFKSFLHGNLFVFICTFKSSVTTKLACIL